MSPSPPTATVPNSVCQPAPSPPEIRVEEPITVKEYLVTWLNPTADEKGYYPIKTQFKCDVKLLSSFMLTLPKAEHEFVCLTDELARQRREFKIRNLERRLEEVKNSSIEEFYDRNSDGALAIYETDSPCTTSGSSYHEHYDYFQSVTYYTRDGKDNPNGFYDKEEVFRYSSRNLLITGIIDDCEQSEVG